jgi:drug/metabolite transporter (DMT)-like permease
MRGRVLAAVAATILIWGFAFIPLKHLLNPEYSSHPLSAEGFLILRFVPLLPLLLVLLAWRARSESPEAFRNDWPWMVVMGLLVVPGYHLPLNFAINTVLHTGLVSLILNLSPVLTYFLAVAIRQERPVPARTAGVLLAFAGLAFIFGEELFAARGGSAERLFSWKGTGLMLLSALAWTTYTLIARRLASRHDPEFLFATSETAGTLAVLAMCPIYLRGSSLDALAALDALDWASWAYVSLLSSFFAYWAWIQALTRYEASRLASSGNLVPLLVHAAAVAFLPRERKAFTFFYLLGAAITVGGTFLVVRSARRAPS